MGRVARWRIRIWPTGLLVPGAPVVLAVVAVEAGSRWSSAATGWHRSSPAAAGRSTTWPSPRWARWRGWPCWRCCQPARPDLGPPGHRPGRAPGRHGGAPAPPGSRVRPYRRAPVRPAGAGVALQPIVDLAGALGGGRGAGPLPARAGRRTGGSPRPTRPGSGSRSSCWRCERARDVAALPALGREALGQRLAGPGARPRTSRSSCRASSGARDRLVVEITEHAAVARLRGHRRGARAAPGARPAAGRRRHRRGLLVLRPCPAAAART